MQEAEVQQIINVIENFEEKKAYVPYFSDLEKHETFWPIFKNLSEEQKHEVEGIINSHILEKIEWMKKTKWGLLFKRFFETSNELFWEFRMLNEKEKKIDTDKFQKLGKQVEQEMFKLEWILTERMFNQEKGLDKVVGSFYNIVYDFFPRYGEIE